MESDFQTRQRYIRYKLCTCEHLNLSSSLDRSDHSDVIDVNGLIFVGNLVMKRNSDGNILKTCDTIAESEDRQQYIKNKPDSISHCLVLEVQCEKKAMGLAHRRRPTIRCFLRGVAGAMVHSKSVCGGTAVSEFKSDFRQRGT